MQRRVMTFTDASHKELNVPTTIRQHLRPMCRFACLRMVSSALLTTTLTACGGGGDSPTLAASNAPGVTTPATTPATTPVTTPVTTPAVTSLAAGYKLAKWAAQMSVTYPTECSMTIVSNGQPNHALDTYYLQPPIGSYTTVVATAPQSGMALVVVPYTAGTVSTAMNFNICPTKASTTTATTGGNIGIMISGPALFNATEGQNGRAAALTDNVSYSFNDSSGSTQTAYFIDSCNGHPTPNLKGNTYHYHGLPPCVTAQVDSAGGPSHIIGIAADGFPIYGNKDINGNVMQLAQMDACNGVTSATPEFPGGVYHYVLPEGVTGFQSSLRCYSGTVTPMQMAALKSQGICETAGDTAGKAPAGAKLPRRTWAAGPGSPMSAQDRRAGFRANSPWVSKAVATSLATSLATAVATSSAKPDTRLGDRT